MFLFNDEGRAWGGAREAASGRQSELERWFYKSCRAAKIRVCRCMTDMLSIYLRAGWRQHGYRSHLFVAVVVGGVVHPRWVPREKVAEGKEDAPRRGTQTATPAKSTSRSPQTSKTAAART